MYSVHVENHAVKQELYDPMYLFSFVSDARGNSTVTLDGLLANYTQDRIRMKQGEPYPLYG